jgi:DNA-binding transcriptional LysR family regulator
MRTDLQHLKRRVKLRDLETLMTVVNAGGMRKAAELLHVSQPAVSKGIAALEDALGVSLLDRSRRGIEVTRYGEALIRRSTAMFDELQQGLRDLHHLADPEGGQVRMACAETINAGLIAAAMERMSRLFPRVTFDVESGDTPVLLTHFLPKRISDFVITRPTVGSIDGTMQAEPLFHARLQVVVGLHSPWARRRKVSLADLADEPWILSHSETTADSPLVLAFRAAGQALPRWCVLSGSLNVRYGLLATGRFVTVMPDSLVRFAGTRGLVKVLPVEIGRWHTATMLVTLRNRSLSPAVNTFLGIVRELSQQLQP